MPTPDPKPKRPKREVTNLATLELLVDAMNNVSEETMEMPTTWRREQVSIAFSKVASGGEFITQNRRFEKHLTTS